MAGLLGDFTSNDALSTVGMGLLNASQGHNNLIDPTMMMYLSILKNRQPTQIHGTNPSYELPPNPIDTVSNNMQPAPAMTPTGASTGMPTGGGDDVGKLVQSIGQLESSNHYGTLGPVTKSGDRAYGKYQVMGNNVHDWTKESLGYPMTTQEFLNNPQAQDAVARVKLGQYLKQTGNIGDASSMWFSGRPMRNNHSRDVLGTSVPEYVRTIYKYYNKL